MNSSARFPVAPSPPTAMITDQSTLRQKLQNPPFTSSMIPVLLEQDHTKNGPKACPNIHTAAMLPSARAMILHDNDPSTSGATTQNVSSLGTTNDLPASQPWGPSTFALQSSAQYSGLPSSFQGLNAVANAASEQADTLAADNESLDDYDHGIQNIGYSLNNEINAEFLDKKPAIGNTSVTGQTDGGGVGRQLFWSLNDSAETPGIQHLPVPTISGPQATPTTSDLGSSIDIARLKLMQSPDLNLTPYQTPTKPMNLIAPQFVPCQYDTAFAMGRPPSSQRQDAATQPPIILGHVYTPVPILLMNPYSSVPPMPSPSQSPPTPSTTNKQPPATSAASPAPPLLVAVPKQTLTPTEKRQVKVTIRDPTTGAEIKLPKASYHRR